MPYRYYNYRAVPLDACEVMPMTASVHQISFNNLIIVSIGDPVYGLQYLLDEECVVLAAARDSLMPFHTGCQSFI